MQLFVTRHKLVKFSLIIALLVVFQDKSLADTASGDAKLFAVSIPSQPVGVALNELSAVTGIPIAFSPAFVAGKVSSPLKGNFSAFQAAKQLLAGSGLVASQQTGGIIINVPESNSKVDALDPITVTEQKDLIEAYTGGQVTRNGRLGMLGNKDMMDTPFGITSYTSQMARNLQAQTVSDVLVNDPSVGLETSRGGWFANFNLRGFTVQSNDTTINGIGGLYPQNLQIPIEFVERIDVLRGPSAQLFGITPNGTVGGQFNIETKRAGEEPLNRIGLSYVSDSFFSTTVDLGRRFGQDKEWGIRVNGSGKSGDLAIDGISRKSYFGSVGVDYKGQKFRFGFDAFLLDEKNRGGSPIAYQMSPTAQGVPKAPENTNNAYKDIKSNSKAYLVLAQGEYDINERWTAKAGFGKADGKCDQSCMGSNLQNGDIDGSYTARAWSAPSTRKGSVYFAGLNGKFNTQAITHQASINLQRIDIDNFYKGDSSLAWTGNIYDPAEQKYDAPFVGSPPKLSTTTLSGIALADTLGFWKDDLQVTLGVRYQKVKAVNFSPDTGNETTSYNSSATSPLATILFRLNYSWSVYANYAEGLSPGTTVNSNYKNDGEVFPPYKSKQYEAGVKWDRVNFANTLSVYQISRPGFISVQPANSLPIYTLNGEQRNRGIEWQFFGQPFEQIRVLGGVIYTQAKLTRTQGGEMDGNTAVGAPKWRSSIGLEYDVPNLKGVTLTGRWTHASSQFANTANNLKIGSWNRFDVGVRYRTKISGRNVNFYANVENVTNKSYWESATVRSITLGWPRTIRLSATMDF